MSVIIGHASIDENRKTRNGNAGDQTGKEVCTRNWYANNWSYVLRCNNARSSEAMALSCEKACANNHIGYDQSQRNALRKQAQLVGYDLSKITTNCECDCSSLMAVCAECAGISIPYSGTNAPTTRTMKSAFVKTGLFQVLTGSNYTNSSDYLQRGDILVKEGSHTVMVLSNGSKVNPSVPTKENYVVGTTYTTLVDLNIREEPFGTKMKFECITQNAKKSSYFDDYGNAILKKGTRVTCKAISHQSNSTWILIPSGWICAKNENKSYIL